MLINVAKRERNLRILIGVLAGVCVWRLYLPDWAQWTLGAIGAVSIITGLIRYCPLNQLFKVRAAD